jgi:hypothetical protein
MIVIGGGVGFDFDDSPPCQRLLARRLALGSRGGKKFGGGGGDQLSERLMDDIVAEIDGTDSSMSLGPSDDDSD